MRHDFFLKERGVTRDIPVFVFYAVTHMHEKDQSVIMGFFLGNMVNICTYSVQSQPQGKLKVVVRAPLTDGKLRPEGISYLSEWQNSTEFCLT